MSQLEVDKIIPQSGTTLTIGDSGDTITISAGATLSGSLNADNLTSGTVPSARVSGAYTGITNLTMSGSLNAGNNVKFGLADANNTILEIGQGATGNKFALTDYVGDTTYTDFGLRIGRNNTGANTDSIIIHRGTGALGLNAQDAGVIQFKTSNVERMRIDSSGNVLVDKTSSNYQTVGHELRDGGRAFHTADGGKALSLVRLSSDGGILDFYKDGTEVGSIGTASTDLFIGSGNTALRFREAGQQFMPWNSTSNSVEDNSIDLGKTDARWKDLYLGGGLYVGGTGTANKLDDYEEGTWTPGLASYGNGTPTIDNSSYIKIGNLVMASTRIVLASVSDGSNFQITGLPFTCKNTTNDVFGGTIHYTSSTVTRINLLVNRNTTSAYLYNNDGTQMTYNTFGNDKQIRLTIIYETD